MKRRFCLALCMLLLTAAVAAAAQDVSAVVRKTLPGVVVVLARGEAGQSQGSGFFVTAKGDVVTNYHVLEGMTSFAVTTNDGKSHPAQLRAYDRERDVAILATQAPSSSYRVLPLAGEVPQIGTAIYAIGAPLGLEKSVSDGLVSQLRKIGNTRYLQVSCPISPGSSGGPVLNVEGEVVGMATSALKGGNNLNFAVPSTILKSFVDYGKDADPIHFSDASPAVAPSPPSFAQPPAAARPAKPQPIPSKQRYVLLSERANFDFYLDTYSVMDKEDLFTLWVLMRFDEKTSLELSRKYFSKKHRKLIVKTQYAVDMRTLELRILQTLVQDETGTTLLRTGEEKEWKPMEEGSATEDLCYYLWEQYYYDQ